MCPSFHDVLRPPRHEGCWWCTRYGEILCRWWCFVWMLCAAPPFSLKWLKFVLLDSSQATYLVWPEKSRSQWFFSSALESLLWCGQCALDHYYAGLCLFCRLHEITSHCVRQNFGTSTDIHNANSKGRPPPPPFAPVYPHLIKCSGSHLNRTHLYRPQLTKERAANIHQDFFFFFSYFFEKFNITVLCWRARKFFFLSWTPSTELNGMHCPSQLSQKLWFPFITPVPSLKQLPDCFSELGCASSAPLVASFFRRTATETVMSGTMAHFVPPDYCCSSCASPDF